MAMVHIECPETGRTLDVWRYQPGDIVQANGFRKPITCPHCGKEHSGAASIGD
jgi:hypothetical protein